MSALDQKRSTYLDRPLGATTGHQGDLNQDPRTFNSRYYLRTAGAVGRSPSLWNSFQPCIWMPPTELRYSHFPLRRPIAEKRSTHLGMFVTRLRRRAHWRSAPRVLVSCLEVMDPYSPSAATETNVRWAPTARCPSEGARMTGHPWILAPRTKAKQFQGPRPPSAPELDALSFSAHSKARDKD